jgi:flagellar basal body-associated protein FliL
MRRGKLLLLVVGLLVVLGGLAGGLYVTGALGKIMGTTAPVAAVEPAPKADGKPTALTGFFDLPEILVMLDPKGAKHRSLLRMLISAQAESQDKANQIHDYQPRLLDTTQSYLRTLSIEDIRGPGKQNQIRAELLKRFNAVLTPLEIQQVLFREVAIE